MFVLLDWEYQFLGCYFPNPIWHIGQEPLCLVPMKILQV